MTNNEAITKLTNIMHDDHYSWSPDVLAAFGMAVEALKGAVGDCISRQAAIVVFRCSGLDDDSKDTVVKVLEQLPSAQPTHDNTSNALKSLDCIDRQAAIDALCKVGCGSEYCGISCDDVKAIEDLPSAQSSFPQRHENDCISRADAIDEVINLWTDKPFGNPALVEIKDCIEALPSVDAVEVVRCKDCKHSEHWYRDKSRCFLWHEEGIDVFEDGYCNYAERKEGET